MYLADLHIHSRYSRATSKNGDLPHLDLWARRKGLTLVGTGDCTHPAWRREMAEQLVPAEDGLYALRPELRPEPSAADVRFIVSGEISCIYKQDGKVRKVHSVVLLPSVDAADRLSLKLEAIGNIRSDGRPILGLSAHDLLAITLDVCPDAIFIPAHIWTPHFSLFGAFSGFDTLEECFGELSGHIHALETGLSSDPVMNRRVPLLDRYQMVSNSDAHSPEKLGRECNILDGPPGYGALKKALDTGDGLYGTVEFFPEAGKYHLDGHRNCDLRLTPEETRAYGGKCPVCGKKLTIGVLNRVEQLAERPESYIRPDEKPFVHLMPLPEVIAASLGVSAAGERAGRVYRRLLAELGPELTILRETELSDIRAAGGEQLAEGIRRLRAGAAVKAAGFDGEYGKIALFTDEELRTAAGQLSFLTAASPHTTKRQPSAKTPKQPQPSAQQAPSRGCSASQRQAADSAARVTAVIAGPGAGKTFTLVERVKTLLSRGVPPESIAAVTFTNKAAAELRTRLSGLAGSERLTVGSFHAICLSLLRDDVALIDGAYALQIARELTAERGVKLPSKRFLQNVSAVKNGVPADCGGAFEAYNARLAAEGLVDFDDLIVLAADRQAGCGTFRHVLVDEFQDVNAAQYRLVNGWLAAGDTLFVIGDPDQAIYGFRGAASDCFGRLTADYPDALVVRLAENYRSTPQIVRAAVQCISPAGGNRLPVAVRPAGAPVRLVECASDMSEGIFIAKEVAKLTGGIDMLGAKAEVKPRAFGEIAVLARTHRALSVIETCLRREGVPCVSVGRSDFADAPVTAGTLAFFRALCFGESAAQAQAIAFLSGEDNFRAAARLFAPRLSERPRALLSAWRDWLHSADKAFDGLIEAAHYADMPAFLEAMLTGGETDISREYASAGQAAVRLSTVHGAKGLEFPVVFVCGMGGPPLSEDEAEERRLLYVALTRAADELIVTFAPPVSPLLAPVTSAQREKAVKPRSQQLSMF